MGGIGSGRLGSKNLQRLEIGVDREGAEDRERMLCFVEIGKCSLLC